MHKRKNRKHKTRGKFLLPILFFCLLLAACQSSEETKQESNSTETELSQTDEEATSQETQLTQVFQLNDEEKEEEAISEEEGENTIIFRFAGDVNLAELGGEGVYMSNMQILDSTYGGDLTKCFSADLLELMISADVFMINNEFTYSTRGTPVVNKDWTFRANPSRVNLLLDIGVDVVGLANNHAFDWGEDALLDTLDTLDDAGIARVGAGEDLSEAMEPYIYTVDGCSVGIVAATAVEKADDPEYGMSRGAGESQSGVLSCVTDQTYILQAIQQAKESCDLVFVYIHWGTESTAVLDDEQVEMAHLYIEAGADAVIGNHPHVLQGFEFYQGKPILYSLGNYWFNSRSRETALLELEVDCDTLEVTVRFLPCLQENCRTVLITDPTEYASRISSMEEISINVSIDENGVVREE